MFNITVVFNNYIFEYLNKQIYVHNINWYFVHYMYIFKIITIVYIVIQTKHSAFYIPIIMVMLLNWKFNKYHIHIKINVGLDNIMSFWHPVWLFILSNVNINILKLKVLQNAIYVLKYSLIFAILGSFWSSQELLWGGWWNWDGVENTILILIIVNYGIVHNKNNKYIIFFAVKLYCAILCVMFFYFNKTSIFKSVHSFTNSVVNNISFLYSLIFFVLIKHIGFLSNKKFWAFLYVFYPFVIFYIIQTTKYINIFLNPSIFKICLYMYVLYFVICKNYKLYLSTIVLLLEIKITTIFIICLLCTIVSFIKLSYKQHTLWTCLIILFFIKIHSNISSYYLHFVNLIHNNHNIKQNYFKHICVFNCSNIYTYIKNNYVVQLFKNLNSSAKLFNMANICKANMSKKLLNFNTINLLLLLFVFKTFFYKSKQFFLINTKKKLKLL